MTDLELALRGLGARLDAGAREVDLTDRVLARLAERTATRPRRRRLRTAVVLAFALLVLAASALAASPGLRADLRRWLGNAGFDVTRTTALPPARTAVSLPELALGAPISPEEAATRLGLKALPEPFGPADAVLAGDAVVSLAWLPQPTLPASAAVPAVGALLTLVPATGENDPMLFGKVLSGSTTVEFVPFAPALDGQAVWIAGAPHVVTMFDGSQVSFRLAANVLVWRVGDLVYRLESGLGRDAMLAAAARG